jgi:hypothetical protein
MTHTRRDFLAQASAAGVASLTGCAPLGAADAPGFDVVVYGGTPGGVAAAVAAARMGASVLLVEQTGHVGGLNTSGINTAETEHMLKWTIGGLALELYERLGKAAGKDGPAYYFLSSTAGKAFEAMLSEAKVAVRRGLRVDTAGKRGARVERIVLSDGSSVAAKAFVDATYEGDLAARAGVAMTWGREGRDEYGEPLAGARLEPRPVEAPTQDAAGALLPGINVRAADVREGAGDRKVMNYNYRLCFTRKPENRAPIPKPERYDRARFRILENWIRARTASNRKTALQDVIDLYPRADGKFEVNNKQAAVVSIGHFGGQFDYPDAGYARRDAIVQDHRDYTLGLLHFLATDEAVPESLRAETASWGLARDEFADNGSWPYYLYIREARRMKGRLVVTQKDVQEDRRKPDAIGMSSHFIDCHHVQRAAVSPDAFANEGRIWRIGWAYQVPYRALTPKAGEADNLLVPVAASFSHVAFCTFRLESVWMIAGHAAGAAAAMAARAGGAAQDVEVAALQKELAAQRQVIDFAPGQPERFPGGPGHPEF